jgi:tetratricopeptide (TPR) repeat protein
MTAQSGRTDSRQLVPRWRAFDDTVRRGELQSLRAARTDVQVDDELVNARRRLSDSPFIYERAELLSTLVARGAHEEAASVARVLLPATNLPATLTSFIRRVAEGGQIDRLDEVSNSRSFDPSEVARTLAQNSRRRLRRFLNNPVAWVDLALAHTIQGNTLAAEKEIQYALQLAPDNRFVLRAAVRLYVHVQQSDKANYVLHTSTRLFDDPWLMAAEISTSQLAFGKSRNLARGRELLSRNNFAPRTTSELASEIATAELQAGHDRRARALFRQSFVDPTENAVAQAASWAERSNVLLEPDLLALDGMYEARALESARFGRWQDATREAASWHRDQPFAIEPFRFASYTASLGSQDFENGAQIAIAGLRLHRGDNMLMNNAAYALANMGRTQEARMYAITPVTANTAEDFISLATLGLIFYREGNTVEGADFYRRSVAGLLRLGRRDVAAMSAIHWSLEETRVDTPTAERVTLHAAKLLPQLPIAERTILGHRMTSALAKSRSNLDLNP